MYVEPQKERLLANFDSGVDVELRKFNGLLSTCTLGEAFGLEQAWSRRSKE